MKLGYKSLMLLIVVILPIVQGCNLGSECGIEDLGHCSGTKMIYCNDQSDMSKYWEEFDDCANYGLTCEKGFVRGMPDGAGDNSSLYCVDKNVTCTDDTTSKCSSDRKYIMACETNYDAGEIQLVLYKKTKDPKFCWESPFDGIPRFVYKEGTCETGDQFCNGNLIINCYDGYWSSATECVYGKMCSETDFDTDTDTETNTDIDTDTDTGLKCL